jgi:hypothetical protein
MTWLLGFLGSLSSLGGGRWLVHCFSLLVSGLLLIDNWFHKFFGLQNNPVNPVNPVYNFVSQLIKPIEPIESIRLCPSVCVCGYSGFLDSLGGDRQLLGCQLPSKGSLFWFRNETTFCSNNLKSLRLF